MRKTLLLFVLLSCSACARTPAIVSIPPAACAKLIPTQWKAGVEAAPIPSEDGSTPLDAVKLWAQAYVAADGQLAKANDRTLATISIFENCEAMVNAARPR